jgi:putative exporter of polyketide antibiotics
VPVDWTADAAMCAVAAALAGVGVAAFRSRDLAGT